MSTYSQIAWLPLTAGLTLIGLIVSFFVWRRRGAAAGLRGVAWSLLPLAAYLIGAIELLWRFGTAITGQPAACAEAMPRGESSSATQPPGGSPSSAAARR